MEISTAGGQDEMQQTRRDARNLHRRNRRAAQKEAHNKKQNERRKNTSAAQKEAKNKKQSERRKNMSEEQKEAQNKKRRGQRKLKKQAKLTEEKEREWDKVSRIREQLSEECKATESVVGIRPKGKFTPIGFTEARKYFESQQISHLKSEIVTYDDRNVGSRRGYTRRNISRVRFDACYVWFHAKSLSADRASVVTIPETTPGCIQIQ